MSRAPVVVDGTQLFLVRGITAYPAEQRAREIGNRIAALAADRSVPTSSLTLDEQQRVVWILAGGQRVMAVLEEDASLEQIDLGRLAQVYQSRVRDAVDAYRRDREPARLGRYALYALVATLALLAAAYAGRRIVGRLRTALERRYEARVRDVRIQAFQIVKAEHIWRFLTGALNLAWAIGVLAIVFVYLRYVLGLFPWTRGLATGLVLVLIVRYVLKMVRLFFHGLAGGTVTLPEFDPEWAWPTYRLVRLAILALAVVVAYPYVPGSVRRRSSETSSPATA